MATLKSYTKRLISLRGSISGTNALIQEFEADIARLTEERTAFETDVSELLVAAGEHGISSADLNAAADEAG